MYEGMQGKGIQEVTYITDVFNHLLFGIKIKRDFCYRNFVTSDRMFSVFIKFTIDSTALITPGVPLLWKPSAEVAYLAPANFTSGASKPAARGRAAQIRRREARGEDARGRVHLRSPRSPPLHHGCSRRAFPARRRINFGLVMGIYRSRGSMLP